MFFLPSTVCSNIPWFLGPIFNPKRIMNTCFFWFQGRWNKKNSLGPNSWGGEIPIKPLFRGGTVDGRNPAPVDMVVHPIIYKVLYIPSGAGFLNHQQLSIIEITKIKTIIKTHWYFYPKQVKPASDLQLPKTHKDPHLPRRRKNPKNEGLIWIQPQWFRCYPFAPEFCYPWPNRGSPRLASHGTSNYHHFCSKGQAGKKNWLVVTTPPKKKVPHPENTLKQKYGLSFFGVVWVWL